MSDPADSTDHTEIDLRPAEQPLVNQIAKLWPMGMTVMPDQPCYALMFQIGQREMHGLKLQPVDVDHDQAMEALWINRIRVALGLGRFRQRGYRGITLPCVYLKEKERAQYESGIAVFAGPSSDGPESAADDPLRLNRHLGAGAGPMIAHMLGDIAGASEERGFPPLEPIGLDVRPRLALGAIQLDVMVVANQVCFLRRQADRQDPIWEALSSGGIAQMWHLPSLLGGRRARDHNHDHN